MSRKESEQVSRKESEQEWESRLRQLIENSDAMASLDKIETLLESGIIHRDSSEKGLMLYASNGDFITIRISKVW